MKPPELKTFRCAVYTRKSTEHNLDRHCHVAKRVTQNGYVS
jgi:hypothetical protein